MREACAGGTGVMRPRKPRDSVKSNGSSAYCNVPEAAATRLQAPRYRLSAGRLKPRRTRKRPSGPASASASRRPSAACARYSPAAARAPAAPPCHAAGLPPERVQVQPRHAGQARLQGQQARVQRRRARRGPFTQRIQGEHARLAERFDPGTAQGGQVGAATQALAEVARQAADVGPRAALHPEAQATAVEVQPLDGMDVHLARRPAPPPRPGAPARTSARRLA